MVKKNVAHRGKGFGKRPLALLLVMMLLATLAGCAKTETKPEQAKQEEKKVAPVELKLAHFWPATHPAELELVQPWAQDIEKATNGQVKITSYPAETLLKATDVYDGVVKGIADIGISCFAYSKGRFPVCEVFELPGTSYNNSKVASKVAWEGIQQLNPKEVQDTHLLMVITTGPGDIYSKTPVKTLADLKGMAIRATGISAKTLQTLGANPVNLPQSEAWEALSKGMVKGNLGPDEVLKGWKQAEVTKYITKAPFLYNTLFFVTMNKDKWNALDPEIQKAIEGVNQKYFEEVAMGLWDKQNADALKWAVDEKGMEVINLSDAEASKWKETVAPIQQEYIATVNKQGLKGEEIVAKVKALADQYNQQYK
ncbi:MAG: TRAP transporter substrate-binding protein [Syntrophomonadaceae bacterium]|nr:TRAP transporter substrate-binding protein [Syntrophomonadaceae bacterium]